MHDTPPLFAPWGTVTTSFWEQEQAPAVPPVQTPPPPPARPAATAPPPTDPTPTPHPAWRQAVVDKAASFEAQVRHQYGPGSPQAARWATLRADLQHAHDQWVATTTLWLAIAEELLVSSPDQAQEAAQGAHQCWQGIPDRAQATQLLPALDTVLRKAGLHTAAGSVTP